MRDYVRVRRAQVDVEAGRRVEVFVPQEHAPGAEAEVDFGEGGAILNGVKSKCHVFVFRLSNSGKAIHRIYPAQAQKAFLEGHIEAFQVLGGIPTRHIREDNLTSAVTAVVFGQGRQRQENDRWAFRSRYGFDPFLLPAWHRRGTRKRRSRRGSGVVPPQQAFTRACRRVSGRAQRPHPGLGSPGCGLAD